MVPDIIPGDVYRSRGTAVNEVVNITARSQRYTAAEDACVQVQDIIPSGGGDIPRHSRADINGIVAGAVSDAAGESTVNIKCRVAPIVPQIIHTTK